MIAIDLPTTEMEGDIAHLTQTIRDAVLRAEKLGLSEAAHILRQAQEEAEKAVTTHRAGTLN
ncbi:MAG: hypothetical protein ACRYGP_05545 [Janthinobacterium lividum]